MASRTIRLTVGVTVIDRNPDTTESDETCLWRVAQAIIPHPDSGIATDKAGEMVTVMVTDWQMSEWEGLK
jgi:hypothetical protein